LDLVQLDTRSPDEFRFGTVVERSERLAKVASLDLVEPLKDFTGAKYTEFSRGIVECSPRANRSPYAARAFGEAHFCQFAQMNSRGMRIDSEPFSDLPSGHIVGHDPDEHRTETERSPAREERLR
jgi:hypothetical protein